MCRIPDFERVFQAGHFTHGILEPTRAGKLRFLLLEPAPGTSTPLGGRTARKAGRGVVPSR
jgi:hypothetical protein